VEAARGRAARAGRPGDRQTADSGRSPAAAADRVVTAEATPGTEAADAADGTEQVALGLGEESGLTPQQQKLLATLVGNSNSQEEEETVKKQQRREK
jgi:hypothetical protein